NQDRPIGFRNLWAHTGDGKLQAFVYPVDSDSPLPHGNLQLTLAPARQFDVSVVDADGKPLGNAWIAGCADYMLVGESRSNADGRATLRVPAGAPLMYVLALKPGLAIDYFAFWGPREIHNNPYRLAQDYAGPLRFVLERANTVTIQVVDGDHHPLAGVSVNPWYFMKPQKGGDLNLFADSHFTHITDAQGRARFDWIPADNQQKINFWTRLEGYAEKDRCLYDPKAAPAELEQTMRKLVHVTGRVLDQEGHPAPSVVVRVGGDGYQMDQFTGQVTTDARGEFAIDVNPEQFYIFVCSVDKLATAPAERIIRDK